VRSNIEKAKGQVRIRSNPGKGSTFEIRIPLTTSITDGIVVAISGQRYMIPIHSIREIVQFRDSEVTQVANVGRVLKIRNKLTPVIDFQQTIEKAATLENREIKKSERSKEQKTYVVLELTGGLSALPVDDVLGQSQVVAKPLQVGHPVPEFSGAATLGDGRTILILEPNALAQAKVGAA
jgi:two-component system, chemotaxis family, sensor kinase CheA